MKDVVDCYVEQSNRLSVSIMMMGCWFVATALGNMLVAVGGFLWGGLNLTVVWSVFIALCLISALFMFVMMKRLESATK